MYRLQRYSALVQNMAHKILTYIKTGYLLHLITAGELALLYIMLHVCRAGAWIMEANTAGRFLLLLPLLWSPLFPQLDARSRYQDYKMMKDCFYRLGFDARLIKPFAKSRCQRDALLVAAAEMGVRPQCARYFKARGYRWYHLFPDIVFEKPAVLFTRSFLVTTFFAKTYHSKIKYHPGALKNSRPLRLNQTAAA